MGLSASTREETLGSCVTSMEVLCEMYNIFYRQRYKKGGP